MPSEYIQKGGLQINAVGLAGWDGSTLCDTLCVSGTLHHYVANPARSRPAPAATMQIPTNSPNFRARINGYFDWTHRP
jgi:hypothetical protein